MSYILEALKKADEARGAAPRAVSMPRALPPVARPRWPWIAAGLGGLAAVIAVSALWALAPLTDRAPSGAAPGGPPPAPVATAPAATALPTTAKPAPVVAREPVAPEPPAAASPRPDPAPAAPAASAAPSAPVEPSASARANSGRDAVERAPRPRASVSPVPPATRAAPPAERAAPPADRAVAAVTPLPAAAKAPVAGVAPAPSPPPPRSEAAPPAATPAAPAGNLRTMVSKLSLQVLSWSSDPKDRFVFVNGRKYVEGQAIDDKLVIERITDGGVVLTYQGERATLRSP